MVSQWKICKVQLKWIYWRYHHQIKPRPPSYNSVKLQKTHYNWLQQLYRKQKYTIFLLRFMVNHRVCLDPRRKMYLVVLQLIRLLFDSIKVCKIWIIRWVVIFIFGILRVFIIILFLLGCMLWLPIRPWVILISLRHIPQYYTPFYKYYWIWGW